jgi:hypothetical protein
VIELNWTRDQVLDQVDVFFLEDLHLFAAYLGHKPPAKPSKNYHDLLAMFPTGTIK